ncbi:tyrosinase cofactor [Streptomyces sp. NBC_00178]|uniref:tyrosinase family oxidase copper chaperone n=1 Tax=Streptomyces sp. NBC_00178 TaxID=2975672 RepID=UPI002E2B68B5|nr:tyrosinase family oxidase copper chaperone [Streptomyces sp. NBC_00178]
MNPNTRTGAEPAGPARRAVLRTAFTVAVVAATGGALAPVLLREQVDGAGDRRDAVGPERFSELYKGREIRGGVTPVVPAGTRPQAAAAGAVTTAPEADVRIDGRPLHVMRRADGSYLSAVNHYESYPTLLETARAAVDEIGAAQLSAAPPHAI